MGFLYWLCTAITLASAFTSLGFSIAAVRSSDGPAWVNSLYTTSRSGAVVVLAAIPVVHTSVAWLTAAAITLILVQVGDAIVGGAQRDRMKTIGPAVLAAVNLVALVLMRTHA